MPTFSYSEFGHPVRGQLDDFAGVDVSSDPLSLITRCRNQASICEVELETFGCTHAHVGAYLFGIWGLPDAIVEAVAFHHNPGQCPAADFGPLAAVHVANVFEQEQRRPPGAPAPAALDTPYLSAMGLDERVPAWRVQCLAIAKGERRTS